MIWDQPAIARLTELHMSGLDRRTIAKALGITPNAVTGKLNRLGLVGTPPTKRYKYRAEIRKNPNRGDWDCKLFESYAERKIRLQQERHP